MMNTEMMMQELYSDPEYIAWLEERAEESMMMEAMEMGIALF